MPIDDGLLCTDSIYVFHVLFFVICILGRLPYKPLCVAFFHVIFMFIYIVQICKSYSIKI